jgi:flagellar assembly protein FliH
MTSTSSEPVVLRDLSEHSVAPAYAGADLRPGEWTRFGADSLRGDAAAETTLLAVAERSAAAARAQGFAAGWADGVRTAQQRAAAGLEAQAIEAQEQHRRLLSAQETALAALEAAVVACRATVGTLTQDLSASSTELAMLIAEAVIGRELQTSTDPGADAIRRAVAAVPGAVDLTVRLHPEDLAALDGSVVPRSVTSVVADPTLRRGDAVVETATSVVDATLSTALQRVRAVLSGEATA